MLRGQTFVILPEKAFCIDECNTNVKLSTMLLFFFQQIDGEALLLLSQADMIHHLKIKLGPALKIANAITKSI